MRDILTHVVFSLVTDFVFAREQQKKLDALQMELGKARQEGFVSNNPAKNSETDTKKKLLAVIGIITRFGHKNNRDAIRKAWMSTGRIPFLFVSFVLFSLRNLMWLIGYVLLYWGKAMI